MEGFDRIVGQDAAKALLRVTIDDARTRGVPLEHIYLSGPSGHAKTTLAEIIAAEMGGRLGRLAGKATAADLLRAISENKLGNGDLIFMDEIHACFSRGETAAAWLNTAMTDRRVGRREIPALTFLFASHIGVRSEAFLTRVLHVELEPLTHEQARELIDRNARLLMPYPPLGPGQANRVARAGNRNPREMLKIIEHLAKLARRQGCPTTFPGHDIDLALAQLQLSRDGLGRRHRAYLSRLHSRWNGGPIGLETLRATLRDPLIESTETLLVEKGLIDIVGKGRVLTRSGGRRAAGITGAHRHLSAA